MARVGRWAFVSCGKVSSSAHPIIKKKLFIIPFLCHISSCPSLVGVMWMFAATPLLVCNACCGLSVGTFYSAPPAAVEPQNKRVSQRVARQAHGARAASAPNWGKMRGTWSLFVGCCWGGVTPPHFPLLLWCHWWGNCRLKPIYSSTLFPKTNA